MNGGDFILIELPKGYGGSGSGYGGLKYIYGRFQTIEEAIRWIYYHAPFHVYRDFNLGKITLTKEISPIRMYHTIKKECPDWGTANKPKRDYRDKLRDWDEWGDIV